MRIQEHPTFPWESLLIGVTQFYTIQNTNRFRKIVKVHFEAWEIHEILDVDLYYPRANISKSTEYFNIHNFRFRENWAIGEFGNSGIFG